MRPHPFLVAPRATKSTSDITSVGVLAVGHEHLYGSTFGAGFVPPTGKRRSQPDSRLLALRRITDKPQRSHSRSTPDNLPAPRVASSA